jgi:hypothetical protein
LGDFEVISSPSQNGTSKRGADPSFLFLPPFHSQGKRAVLPPKDRVDRLINGLMGGVKKA